MNRTRLLICLFLGFGFSLMAQPTSQGNFMIGSTLGFSSSSSEVDVDGGDVSVNQSGTRSTQFNIAPKIGYFIAPNWNLGIGMDYTLNEVKDPNGDGSGNEFDESFDSDLLFGPFTRYYLPVQNDMAFSLEATFGFGSSRNQIDLMDGNSQTINNDVIAFWR